MQKRIASIYFAPVLARRPLYGGYFEIPAVEKNAEPHILVIDDKVQRSQEPSPDGSTRVMQRYLIEGRDIAVDILREWTAESVGMTPDCRPGVWIVRDEVPLTQPSGLPQYDADGKAMWRQASEEERVAMWAEDRKAAEIAQANWADYLIRSGDVLAEDPKQWVLISNLMRVAARHFGKERPWLQELKDNDVKHCQWCTKAIPVFAVKCGFCHEIVDPERYVEMARKRDAVLEQSSASPVRPPVQSPRQPARA
jgi:predicted nucleic acid-binding Zn ribbon protein